MKRNDRRWRDLLVGTGLAAILAASTPLGDADAAHGETPTAPAGDEVTQDEPVDALEPNEIDALVAAVVFYPDPLLSLVLQASISPLDMWSRPSVSCCAARRTRR